MKPQKEKKIEIFTMPIEIELIRNAIVMLKSQNRVKMEIGECSRAHTQ